MKRNLGRNKTEEPEEKLSAPEEEIIPLMGFVVMPRPKRRNDESEIEEMPASEEEAGDAASKYLPHGTRAQNLRSQSAEVEIMNNFIPLEDVRVATPCRADWDKMQGDDRARFCGSCTKHVYNLSDMTRADAERLIAEKEGHLCVRFYQRADGTMLTKDCPVGITQRRRPFWALTGGFAALMASAVAVFGGSADASTPVQHVSPNVPWRSSVEQWREVPLLGSVVNMVSPPAVMGAMAPCPMPAPTPTATPAPDEPDIPPIMGEIALPHQ